jgi:hypothetical protein
MLGLLSRSLVKVPRVRIHKSVYASLARCCISPTEV